MSAIPDEQLGTREKIQKVWPSAKKERVRHRQAVFLQYFIEL